ncbi:hypothetical protein EJ05DRAFT_504348 [Pseudovirgaria hyperparasitica]|uniref:Uncharacterized protein n=1 Tax=Pseudovirgaria hyperparasitica TaxID=470096 RepID=A0A6A6VZL3_9PEZI|nr:uncharacterized protein EJ05DRAFT_504348 [Pseudovirgaria hyperparasitica]KAF2754251.1 hypothetical protein EJ05DRAFT_504348 [Pseudovirgaria hyperparasitica]
MHHPFQCLATFGVTQPSSDEGGLFRRNILFAASGPQILTVNIKTGHIVSTWPLEDTKEPEDEQPGSKDEKGMNLAARPKIINLVAVNDGAHLIAVTGEDKCIRVFGVDAEGRLSELSERSMPKRPCAIGLTPDNRTIICGDKFGDVYAIPLQYEERIVTDSVSNITEEPKKTFVPSASEKTVHSARNRRALEDQRKQALVANAKEPLKFEHQLLLGHVSLLTDLLSVTTGSSNTGDFRHYILTSDRDEHIRVSRGPPQAHIIENYCLGHAEFVSKLLLVTPDVLISGGGDDHLIAWDWKAGRKLAQLDLRDLVVEAGLDGEVDIAVSGLWSIYDEPRQRYLVLVALEGVPTLLTFIMSVDNDIVTVSGRAVTSLPGNLICLIVMDKSIVVSSDSLKQDKETSHKERLSAYTLDSNFIVTGKSSRDLGEMWQIDPAIGATLSETNGHSSLEASRAQVNETVYSIRSLRKRGGYGEESQL